MKRISILLVCLSLPVHAGVVARVSKFIVNQAPICSQLLSKKMRTRFALENKPEFLTSAHFLSELARHLPSDAYLPNHFFYINEFLQRSRTIRLRFEEKWAEWYGARFPSSWPTPYDWAFARFQVTAEGILVYNWEPEQTVFSNEDGQVFPSALRTPLIGRLTVDQVLERAKTGGELRHGMKALGDKGEVLELVVRTHPFYEFLEDDGSLRDDFFDLMIWAAAPKQIW